MLRESTEVKLKITSATLAPADLEARLGAKADESWKIGDRLGTFGAQQKTHGLLFDAQGPMSGSVEDHIRSLLKRVAPFAPKVAELAAAGAATIEVLCQITRKAAPPLRLEKDDLRWLAYLNARLDISVNILVERSAEPAKKPGEAPKPTSGF
jgi:hypothetical protein